MSLELNKVSAQVEAMGIELAARQREDEESLVLARASLAEHAQVTDEIRNKIRLAREVDASWRGAQPLGDRLDAHPPPALEAQPATLIATDGSQIYPDRHGIAPYYLINIGSITLRQGSGEVPSTNSQPLLFYSRDEVYDEKERLRNVEFINRERDCREIQTLADLAEAEREALGGDLSRTIVALLDGPLLFWAPERPGDMEDREAVRREVAHFTGQLTRLRKARAIPIGYIDRPSSANVLRTLELADLAGEAITRDTVRQGPYRSLADRRLFANLGPGERSALFASTSEVNDRYTEAGQRIAFFYANMACRAGEANAVIARIELPEWVAQDEQNLEQAHAALYADCELTGLPYVLVRAHELAVVSGLERAEFEAMLGQFMIRNGLAPLPSAKAIGKQLTGSRRISSRRR